MPIPASFIVYYFILLNNGYIYFNKIKYILYIFDILLLIFFFFLKCKIGLHWADCLPWLSHAVQLRSTGEDGALAMFTRVDRHFIHHHFGARESQTGKDSHSSRNRCKNS